MAVSRLPARAPRVKSRTASVASVPFGDLDRLAWRVGAAIEIARTTGQESREK
jgi:hypothetical protein